jgi:hypothetical protein
MLLNILRTMIMALRSLVALASRSGTGETLVGQQICVLCPYSGITQGTTWRLWRR